MNENYIAISDLSIHHFMMSINDAITFGYRPTGGIFVVIEPITVDHFYPTGTPTSVYYQAMVK